MSWLPRVERLTRERVSREFDDLGPQACVAEIVEELRGGNPELLDIARRSAAGAGNAAQVMQGFAMFYRLLSTEAAGILATARTPRLDALPRVAPDTRERVVKEIERDGAASFMRKSLADLERTNPELLLMADRFASRQEDYLATMQGFALLSACLLAQAARDRGALQ